MGTIRLLLTRIDAGFLVTLTLTTFSGVYLTKAGVSPIYISTLLGLAALAAWILAARGAAPLSMWAQSLCVVLLAVPIAIYDFSLDASASGVVNFLIGPILGSLIPMAGRQLSRRQLIFIARTFVLATLAVAVVECAYRLTHPDFSFLEDAATRRSDLEDIAFYAYKFNSLMYLDSNFVGLQLAVLFAFLLGLSHQGVRIPRSWYLATGMLTMLTLSRASIFTVALLLCIEAYLRFAKGPVLKTLVAFMIASAVSGAYFSIQDDASFATKFDILNRFADYMSQADFVALIFGVGVGHAVDVLHIGAHNLVVTYVVELGLLLTIVLFGFWTYMVKAAPTCRYMVIALLINGFALTTLAIPYFYASAAMLLLMHRQQASHPTILTLGETIST